MLKTIANSTPGFAAFTNFCYSQHSKLFYDKFVVGSESSIQKRDTLGPMFFFSDALAHYEKFREASTSFLVSRWWCLGGLRARNLWARTWSRPPSQVRQVRSVIYVRFRLTGYKNKTKWYFGPWDSWSVRKPRVWLHET